MEIDKNIWRTFGHNSAKKILDLQAKSGRFAHTYLFLGPEGVGKKMLALEFAGKILQTEKLNNHTDFLFFDVTAETGIEQVRDFADKLSLKPFVGEKKVAVINNAQNLNTQSQNALLKTLEEPPSSCILILVSSQPLLATIISRSLVLHFNRFSQKQMREFANFADLNLSQEKIANSFGLPARALAVLDNIFIEWEQIKRYSRAEKLLVLPKWAEKDAENLSEMFESFAQSELGNLTTHPKNFKNVSELLVAAKNLKRNFNKKLVLQKLFLNI